jgi:hypothetical protein
VHRDAAHGGHQRRFRAGAVKLKDSADTAHDATPPRLADRRVRNAQASDAQVTERGGNPPATNRISRPHLATLLVT